MNKFKFIGCALGFLIMAAISCWATEQSLHLVLPTGWPEILVWGITIAFFVIAAIGTKLITDVLMDQGFVENRKLKLFGGILLVIFFWLLMSMPTNTHTFFYNDQIGAVVTKDIETTNQYLNQIVIKGTSDNPPVDSIGKDLATKTNELKNNLIKEFKGDISGRSGNGQNVADYLTEINNLLGSNIKHNTAGYNSKDNTILNNYILDINKALDTALEPHKISSKSIESAGKQMSRLSILNDSLQNSLSTGTLSEYEIKQIEKELKDGYNIIWTNQKFVDFTPETGDEEVYTTENVEPRTKRLASVIEVFFVDFLGGKYPASFWYYVMLSILVDIAAFIFFDIAFKKQ